MAGSYKDMFEHVSSGYEKLSTGSARELFQQRVDALLIGAGRSTGEGGEAGKLLGGAALAGAAGAASATEAASAAAAGATTESGTEAAQTETAAPAQTSEPTTEGLPEPEWRSEPTLETGSQGAVPAVEADAEAAAATRELEPSAADESDERMRRAEGIAFDPTLDEAPVRGEAPRSELR